MVHSILSAQDATAGVLRPSLLATTGTGVGAIRRRAAVPTGVELAPVGAVETVAGQEAGGADDPEADAEAAAAAIVVSAAVSCTLTMRLPCMRYASLLSSCRVKAANGVSYGFSSMTRLLPGDIWAASGQGWRGKYQFTRLMEFCCSNETQHQATLLCSHN